MKIVVRILLLVLITSASVSGQKKINLSSPNGLIQYSFRLINKAPTYTVSFKNKSVISDSEIGLSFLDGEFKANLKIGKPRFKTGEEKYELIIGKRKHVNDQYREVIIPMTESATPFRTINLVVRAFNDGVAFRYEFPEQAKWTSYTLTDENSTFRIIGDPKALVLKLPGYTTSHEDLYTATSLQALKEGELVDLPALFELKDQKTFLAITEASLLDFAGMYLTKRNGALITSLAPSSGDKNAKVKANLPHHTPWRVMMIGDRVGALIESTILTSLSEPCKIEDTSWIKPGKTTFPWWNGTIVPDTTFAPGNNFETNKYYIDFCARNGIEYHSVVEFGGHEWYVNDGGGYQPGPNVDVTKPVPGLDMQEVCDYAKQKGVGVRVWVHWVALYPKLDEAFALFEKWGLKGMMVDFMDRDDQEMNNIREEILQKAAKHKLHIQFHGVDKPSGLSRTYPNEFTREGVMNYEYNKWGKIDPDHDINIPFTRMLAGATDYHMGGFRAIPDSLYKIQHTRPLMVGTRCHMMAMYVVWESALGMVCDYPAAYEGQPGFDFVSKVPTTWDETKVLDAKVGEYIIIARKKNDEWYVGAITNHQPRELTVDLSFLGNGNYDAEMWTDAPDVATSPNHLKMESKKIDMRTSLKVALGAGGGAVMHIKKSK